METIEDGGRRLSVMVGGEWLVVGAGGGDG